LNLAARADDKRSATNIAFHRRLGGTSRADQLGLAARSMIDLRAGQIEAKSAIIAENARRFCLIFLSSI
jgi:hypothetical protein